jgi:hypothetical protein
MNYFLNRFSGWMSFKPFIGLLMITATLVLFMTVFNKGSDKGRTFWDWIRRFIEAAGVAILFTGLLWAFRAILSDNISTFNSNHGRVSMANYNSVKNIWGAPHVQNDLKIWHTIEEEYMEEIPREDPTKPPLYKKKIRTVNVEQNSILSSHGNVKLLLSQRKKGTAYYNGFEAEFSMNYKIINDSGYTTDAHFLFPLNSEQLLFNPFEITENGVNIGQKYRFSHDGVQWEQKMKPAKEINLNVHYKTRGLEYFYYQIQAKREIQDFSLVLTVDGLNVKDINYPEGCLPPTEKIRPTEDQKGSVLEWKLDRAVTIAGMGISLPIPEQPGAKISLVLDNSPYALMLLIVLLCLTFLIQGHRINFLELALLSGVYCLLFITMASVSDFILGFWGSLILGAALTLGLTYILYRNTEPLMIKVIIMVLVGFFTLIYPLSGLFPDYQDSFNGIVNIGMIIYLFFIALHSRINQEAVQRTKTAKR